MAKGGSFDLVMVHARALEDRFLADGFGVDRRDVMYNDFVILGPSADPARIRGERRAVDALRRIAAAEVGFLTRGDNSGTHVKEVELWQAAGVTPRGAWYVKSERGAAGNAPTTRDADARGAYALMDRATYLTLKKVIALQVLVERDPALLNYIAVIRVNPSRLPKVNADGARAFLDWLVSEEAQQLIKAFEVDALRRAPLLPQLRRLAQAPWRRVMMARLIAVLWLATAVLLAVALAGAALAQSGRRHPVDHDQHPGLRAPRRARADVRAQDRLQSRRSRSAPARPWPWPRAARPT